MILSDLNLGWLTGGFRTVTSHLFRMLSLVYHSALLLFIALPLRVSEKTGISWDLFRAGVSSIDNTMSNIVPNTTPFKVKEWHQLLQIFSLDFYGEYMSLVFYLFPFFILQVFISIGIFMIRLIILIIYYMSSMLIFALIGLHYFKILSDPVIKIIYSSLFFIASYYIDIRLYWLVPILFFSNQIYRTQATLLLTFADMIFTNKEALKGILVITTLFISNNKSSWTYFLGGFAVFLSLPDFEILTPPYIFKHVLTIATEINGREDMIVKLKSTKYYKYIMCNEATCDTTVQRILETGFLAPRAYSLMSHPPNPKSNRVFKVGRMSITISVFSNHFDVSVLGAGPLTQTYYKRVDDAPCSYQLDCIYKSLSFWENNPTVGVIKGNSRSGFRHCLSVLEICELAEGGFLDFFIERTDGAEVVNYGCDYKDMLMELYDYNPKMIKVLSTHNERFFKVGRPSVLADLLINKAALGCKEIGSSVYKRYCSDVNFIIQKLTTKNHKFIKLVPDRPPSQEAVNCLCEFENAGTIALKVKKKTQASQYLNCFKNAGSILKVFKPAKEAVGTFLSNEELSSNEIIEPIVATIADKASKFIHQTVDQHQGAKKVSELSEETKHLRLSLDQLNTEEINYRKAVVDPGSEAGSSKKEEYTLLPDEEIMKWIRSLKISVGNKLKEAMENKNYTAKEREIQMKKALRYEKLTGDRIFKFFKKNGPTDEEKRKEEDMQMRLAEVMDKKEKVKSELKDKMKLQARANSELAEVKMESQKLAENIRKKLENYSSNTFKNTEDVFKTFNYFEPLRELNRSKHDSINPERAQLRHKAGLKESLDGLQTLRILKASVGKNKTIKFCKLSKRNMMRKKNGSKEEGKIDSEIVTLPIKGKAVEIENMREFYTGVVNSSINSGKKGLHKKIGIMEEEDEEGIIGGMNRRLKKSILLLSKRENELKEANNKKAINKGYSKHISIELRERVREAILDKLNGTMADEIRNAVHKGLLSYL